MGNQPTSGAGSALMPQQGAPPMASSGGGGMLRGLMGFPSGGPAQPMSDDARMFLGALDAASKGGDIYRQDGWAIYGGGKPGAALGGMRRVMGDIDAERRAEKQRRLERKERMEEWDRQFEKREEARKVDRVRDAFQRQQSRAESARQFDAGQAAAQKRFEQTHGLAVDRFEQGKQDKAVQRSLDKLAVIRKKNLEDEARLDKALVGVAEEGLTPGVDYRGDETPAELEQLAAAERGKRKVQEDERKTALDTRYVESRIAANEALALERSREAGKPANEVSTNELQMRKAAAKMFTDSIGYGSDSDDAVYRRAAQIILDKGGSTESAEAQARRELGAPPSTPGGSPSGNPNVIPAGKYLEGLR